MLQSEWLEVPRKMDFESRSVCTCDFVAAQVAWLSTSKALARAADSTGALQLMRKHFAHLSVVLQNLTASASERSPCIEDDAAPMDVE
jgi:hypothetical protein